MREAKAGPQTRKSCDLCLAASLAIALDQAISEVALRSNS
jgi:hypothetical protein